MGRFTYSTVFIAFVLLTGCGGNGGGRVLMPHPPGGPGPVTGSTGTARVTLTFPAGTGAGAAARKTSSYLSPKTRSVGLYLMTVNGAAPPAFVPPTLADIGPTASSCSTSNGTLTCTFAAALPTGNDGISVRTFPTTGENGPPLSIGTAVVSVVSGQTVDAPITLLPLVAVAITTITPNPISGTGPGTATLSISAKDFAGDVIGGSDPYYTPIAVSTMDTSGHVVATPALPAMITAPGQSITLAYDGKGSAPYFTYVVSDPGDTFAPGITPYTGTLGLTQSGGQSVYVAAAGDNAIYVYAAGPGGSNTLIRQISGSLTTLANPVSVAVDKLGALYVANYGRDITVYAPGASGNVAPILTFGGGTAQPDSIALSAGLDPVTTGPPETSASAPRAQVEFYYSIYSVTPVGGSFNSALALPGAVGWSGSSSGQACVARMPIYDNPYVNCFNAPSVGGSFDWPESAGALTFRSDGLLAVAREPIFNRPDPAIVTYALPGSGTGFIPPPPIMYNLSGPATGLAAPHQIDFDKAGYMYVANYGFSSYGGTIGIFAPNATGNTAP
ncbi:MAG: hypothetical protein M3126_07385, partial [Candidatus Eremiobacteraeota bacterium]|nr:hypothetical protein [Candidatus Eremiobacteraeota bacterium]